MKVIKMKLAIFLGNICALILASVDENKLTSISGSGVCFYGKTAERVLNILASGEHRLLLPSVHRPKDCTELNRKVDKSGIYKIYPDNGSGFKVYCDMKTDGGGWTVLVRREDGSQDFRKNWIDYENGFGDKKKEFWLGNKYIHRLTRSGNTEMRVDLENFKAEKRYAKYSTFTVGDAASKYKLTVSGYKGTAGDAMGYNNGMKFTTGDNDNDTDPKQNCASLSNRGGSGWWYKACELASLTLPYKGVPSGHLMQWENWKGSESSLKYASMMIRKS